MSLSEQDLASDLETVRLSSDGVFYTLQGEGPLVGVPSLFVRLDTCNLRCKWGEVVCDAHYTSWNPGQLRVSLSDLCGELGRKMLDLRCRHVVITGGEPCLQEHALKELCQAVLVLGGHTTIETNATRWVSTCADLICMSPKLSSSIPINTKYAAMHQDNRINLEAIKQFMAASEYFFKFVIDREEDILEATRLLEKVGQKLDPQRVLFMPQGIDNFELNRNARWLAERCKKLGVRFTPRLQIAIWGNKPGT